MTHLSSVAAPASSDTIGLSEPALLRLDPDTAELIAELDAILCAALAPARRPPAPPVTWCALLGPRSAGWSYGALVQAWSGPVHQVLAVQRSPPTSTAR